MRRFTCRPVTLGAFLTLMLLAIALLPSVSTLARADEAAIRKLSAEDQQALRLGRQVIAVRKAIKAYDSPGSLKSIRDVGTITANYVWVRGWLNEELRTATHMLSVRKGKARDDLQTKVTFLKRSIRAIDLE
jgi:hypothetical protein